MEQKDIDKIHSLVIDCLTGVRSRSKKSMLLEMLKILEKDKHEREKESQQGDASGNDGNNVQR